MPLTPFDPRLNTFLLGVPHNRSSTGPWSGGLAVTASSEANGAPAENMLFDNNDSAWRSGPLGGNVVVEWDLGQPRSMSLVSLTGNLQLPAGWQFQAWPGTAGVGPPLYDSGPGLDCVVRSDDTVLDDNAAERVNDSRNLSPVRMPTTIEARGLRATFDTSGGNGGPDFLELTMGWAGEVLDVGKCLSANGVTYTQLPSTRSVGGAGSGVPRTPLRANDIPLSYLERNHASNAAAWTGTRRARYKCLFWPTPEDLDSWSYAAFLGVLTGKVKIQRISPRIASVPTMEIQEEN